VFGLAAADTDATGAFLVGLVSVLPALLFLSFTGLSTFMEAHVATDSWLNGGLLNIPLSLVIVYLFGWAMSAVVRQLRCLDERIIDWMDRASGHHERGEAIMRLSKAGLPGERLIKKFGFNFTGQALSASIAGGMVREGNAL
jgi:hypothetical protein